MAWLVPGPAEKKKTNRGEREEWKMEKRLKRKGVREGQDGTGLWQQQQRRAQLKGQ